MSLKSLNLLKLQQQQQQKNLKFAFIWISLN